jgi:UDP-N-acetylmuramate: L-alanyl-gamma-D-glutamyl-meso-diaminopimelate ligase
MQVRGVVDGVTVLDDFAHHPTAVRETLQAVAQKYPRHRIIAIFEPRSWTSRKKVFQQQYAQAFSPASEVVIAPLFESFRLAPEDQLSVEELVAALTAQGKFAASIEGAEAIVAHLVPRLQSGDVVVIMSNGGFGGIHQKMLDALESRSRSSVT